MDSKTRWATRIFNVIKKKLKKRNEKIAEYIKMVRQEDLHSQRFTSFTVILNQELLGNDVISMMGRAHMSFEPCFFWRDNIFVRFVSEFYLNKKNYIFLLFILC